MKLVAVLLGFLIIYHHLLYPLMMASIARLQKRLPAVADPDPWPMVTLLIAAYNEERVIGEKIRNSLQLDYPRDLLEILVVTDGSSDGTPAVVEQFAGSGVRLLHEPARRGKGNAINRGVAASRGSILVLSDANNFYTPDAIRYLVRALARPEVGGVSGAKRVNFDPQRLASRGDGLYWRFESQLKNWESRLGGTVSADGEIFAIRRENFAPIPQAIVNDDLFLTLELAARGLQLSYESRACAYEEGSLTLREDFRVKVRMISGGLQNVAASGGVVFGSGLFTFKFLSHKLLRWFMPLLLASFLAVSWGLRAQDGWGLLWPLQLGFYGVAALGALLNLVRLNWTLTYVPFYFVAMNLAAAAGILRFARGTQSPLWDKARR